MRWIRLGWIVVIALVVGVAVAQEDLGWLLNFIPTGEDIDLEKQLEQGAIPIVAGDSLLDESFTALNAWESSSDREGNRRVRNDRYEMRLVDNDIIYTGLGTQEYENVIINVDTQRLSTEPNDGYGLVCRASDEDNGVHFYVSSDGYWRIFAFVNGRARPFMPWTASELINQGTDARNQITAVCVNDYFALYINGVLAGEARDNTFTSGLVGMSVIVFEENSEVFIGFDNLRVWSATSDAEFVPVTNNSNTSNAFIDEQRAETVLLLGDGGETVALNSLILYDTMDDASNWQVINNSEGDASFDDGRLSLVSDEGSGYPIILASPESYNNVVIQAEATFEDGAENNAFGLVCRASSVDIGRSYQFVISADGYYAVWVTDGSDYRFVADWERSSAINTNSSNLLTAVCIDDYFAFYVNDSLVVDLYNDVFLGGTIGMTAYTFEDDENTEISFDNVFIWDAELR